MTQRSLHVVHKTLSFYDRITRMLPIRSFGCQRVCLVSVRLTKGERTDGKSNSRFKKTPTDQQSESDDVFVDRWRFGDRRVLFGVGDFPRATNMVWRKNYC